MLTHRPTFIGTPNTAFPISTGEYTKMPIEGFLVTCQMVPLQYVYFKIDIYRYRRCYVNL